MRRLVLLLAVVLLLAGCHRTADHAATTAPTTTLADHPGTTVTSDTVVSAATKCDPALWRHVYHPARLKVIKACAAVTGRIAVVRYEPDGDAHIRLTVEEAYRTLLTPANAQQHGDMVLEPVCLRPPTQADARPACAGYRSPVKVPPVGTRIRVVGSYVLDLQHGGWAEIHPVTSIAVISAPPTTAVMSAYYANCAAARAAGTAPLHRGEPGYRSGLDRDGDGVACE